MTDLSPVLMCNASKPSKKMPSYKPLPKLAAHIPSDKVMPSHARPYSTQDAAPAFNYPVKEYDQKKVDLNSRNKDFIDARTGLEHKVMNTYQPEYQAPVGEINNPVGS